MLEFASIWTILTRNVTQPTVAVELGVLTLAKQCQYIYLIWCKRNLSVIHGATIMLLNIVRKCNEVLFCHD